MRHKFLIGLTLVTFTAAAGTGLAAPRKAKPMKIPASIVLENKRSVELVSLTISPSGTQDKILVTLKKPLGPDKKMVLSLKGLKTCSVTLSGTFADDGDANGEVDVCHEKSIALVE